MLRKLFVFILLSTVSTLTVLAQEKAPKKPKKMAQKAYRIAIGGSGSYLGVEIKEVTKENFSEMGLSEVRGVGISKVLKDSPAEKAGLQNGDVIVRFNGESVTSSRKLIRLINEVSVDHTATLNVVRSGSEIEIPVTMGKRKGSRFFGGNFEFPTPPEVPATSDFPMPDVPPVTLEGLEKQASIFRLSSSRTIGVNVTSLTKQLGEYFGVTDGKGLLVKSVYKNSPAEKAGLQAGDVIVEVDGKTVNSSFDLMRSIGDEKDGEVNLIVIRDKNRQTVTVTPEKRKGGEMFFNNFEFGEVDREKLKTMERKLKELRFKVAPEAKGVSMPLRIRTAPRVI